MDFSPGTDALIQATTLENQFYSLAITIQAIERNSSHNPNDDINIITATYDSDTAIFSGSIDTYANVTWLADGTHSITYPDPYTNYTSWSEGTGGQGNATNINHALAQRALWLIEFERSETYNLGNVDPKFTGATWTHVEEQQTLPIIHNAKLAIDFSIELELLNSSNGTQYQAKSYLTGVMPNP